MGGAWGLDTRPHFIWLGGVGPLESISVLGFFRGMAKGRLRGPGFTWVWAPPILFRGNMEYFRLDVSRGLPRLLQSFCRHGHVGSWSFYIVLAHNAILGTEPQLGTGLGGLESAQSPKPGFRGGLGLLSISLCTEKFKARPC